MDVSECEWMCVYKCECEWEWPIGDKVDTFVISMTKYLSSLRKSGLIGLTIPGWVHHGGEGMAAGV